MIKRVVFSLLLLSLWPVASLAQRVGLPMPPTFAPNTSIEQTLRGYPLGVITEQAAFSHHGGPRRKLTLPNGLAGWVYDVGGVPTTVPYVSPTGRKQAVKETEAAHPVRSYTLVFDNRGVVVDVLYNEDGRHDGLTALSLQNVKGRLRSEEHTDPGPQPGGKR